LTLIAQRHRPLHRLAASAAACGVLLTTVGCTKTEEASRAPAAIEAPAPAAESVAPEPSQPTVQHVDIGGYKLALLVRGAGGPTVVIEPGMGLPAVESDEWKPVADEVSKTTTVVLYDRAGLGSSEPSPKRPRTSQDAAQELHTLLTNAKVPGPYILVAHSLGGYNARLFAQMYPSEVAGMVFVDIAHPDQEAKWLPLLPAETPGENPVFTKSREFVAARINNHGENPDNLDLVVSRDQVRATDSLGDMPLAVLTHSPKWKMVPNLPDDVMQQIEQASQELQKELPGLSTNSSHKIAETAGHGIHIDDPALVIAAINEVITKVKAAPPK